MPGVPSGRRDWHPCAVSHGSEKPRLIIAQSFSIGSRRRELARRALGRASPSMAPPEPMLLVGKRLSAKRLRSAWRRPARSDRGMIKSREP